jgi:hypothetical protein
VELTRPGPVSAAVCDSSLNILLSMTSAVLHNHRLKPQRATSAEATTQSGSRVVPEQGRHSVDFLHLRHF